LLPLVGRFGSFAAATSARIGSLAIGRASLVQAELLDGVFAPEPPSTDGSRESGLDARATLGN
jgi:hypothetical protein